jgi:threonine dehydrogenase-like Zn-dependent dehydrogenase
MNPSDFTRRHFLKVPAAIGGAALLPAQSPNDTVRVAFIGVGNRGSYLLQHMLKVPGIRVVAICDIDPRALERRARPGIPPTATPTTAGCWTARTSTPW